MGSHQFSWRGRCVVGGVVSGGVCECERRMSELGKPSSGGTVRVVTSGRCGAGDGGRSDLVRCEVGTCDSVTSEPCEVERRG